MNSVSLTDFMFEISHSKCIEGHIEKTEHKAYKIDDSDGVCQHLKFPNHLLSKVDYFLIKEEDVLLLELTDLRDWIKNSSKELTSELSRTEMKCRSKVFWQPLCNEFSVKWAGSIAIIERLYRKNKIASDPNYKLCIVCKNGTDIIILNRFIDLLKGRIKDVIICTTDRIGECLNLTCPNPPSS